MSRPPATLTISGFLVLASTIGGGQPSARFDVEKASAYGAETRKAIPSVTQDDAATTGACETVELASPPLRLARTARAAKSEGRALDAAAATTAGRPTLSALYSRLPFQTGHRVQTGGRYGAPSSAPTPCGETRKPRSLALVSRSGAALEPLAAIDIQERPGTGKFFASKTTLMVTAEFDVDAALALAEGDGFEVRVVYAEGKPGSFRFHSRQWKELFPSWAR